MSSSDQNQPKYALKVYNLGVSFSGRKVLDDVNMEIPCGKLVYLLGANGSGKSTLIKAILGLIEPDEGAIEIMGKPASQEVVASNIGYVPQYSQIDRNFPISVEEMIELDCVNSGNCRVGVRGHLKFLDIDHLQNRNLSELSGGEFQKVLIARAFVNDPEILILDEPINNLDHNSQDELIRLLQRINKEQKKTIIIISHDHQIINADEDTVFFLSNCKVKGGRAKVVLKEHLSHPGHEHH